MPRSFILLAGNQELELAAAALYGKNTTPGDTPIFAGSTGVLRAAPARSSDGAEATFTTGTADAQASGSLAFVSYAFTFVFNGASWDRRRTPNIFKDIPSTAVTAGTGVTIWTPTSGKKFRLMGWALTLSVAGSIIFGDNAIGTIIYRTPLLLANTPLVAPPMGNGFLSAAANNVLKADVTATGNISGLVFGTEE